MTSEPTRIEIFYFTSLVIKFENSEIICLTEGSTVLEFLYGYCKILKNKYINLYLHVLLKNKVWGFKEKND